MPYRNILWIKLEKRLLNDYRFYSLPEDAQLVYIKLLLLAAETDNHVPKDPKVLQSCLRSELSPTRINECIEMIQKNFPKFKNSKNYYCFGEWGTKRNRLEGVLSWDAPGAPQGRPRGALEKRREDKIRIDKIRGEKKDILSPSQEAKLFFENEEFRDKTLAYFTEKGAPIEFVKREALKFTSYWTELNKSGTKQRWELEGTFEIKKRLNTWCSRAAQYEKEKSPKNRIGIAI